MRSVIRILHMHPDLAMGGGQVLLLRNIRAMERFLAGCQDMPRFEHAVCAVRPEMTLAEEYRRAGVEVHSLEVRSATSAVRALPQLIRLLRRRRIDLVHTNNTYSDRTLGLLAAAATRTPAVNTLHSQPPELFRPKWRDLDGVAAPKRPWHLLRDRPLRLPREFIAVSEDVHRAWRLLLGGDGARGPRITTITPGIEVCDAPPADLRGMLPAPASPLLLAVGRLVSGKGHQHLVTMMKHILLRFPTATLLIAGEGPMRPQLERLVSQCGLHDRIILLGMRGDVPNLLAACDVFLFPTHAEGFGLVALEAMAARRAVVASDLPVLASFIEHGRTGLLAPVANPEAWATAVLELLQNPPRREALGTAARRAVTERFGEAAVARSLAGVYLRVLGLPAPGMPAEVAPAGFSALAPSATAPVTPQSRSPRAQAAPARR